MTHDEIRKVLATEKRIAIIWAIEDVQTIREDLTDEQAWQVLLTAERKMDASIGINWDVLREHADWMFPIVE